MDSLVVTFDEIDSNHGMLVILSGTVLTILYFMFNLFKIGNEVLGFPEHSCKSFRVLFLYSYSKQMQSVNYIKFIKWSDWKIVEYYYAIRTQKVYDNNVW